jgi:hypothetical protein
MAQLALPCPYCEAEKIGFTPRGAVEHPSGATLMFLQCQGCGEGIIATVNDPIHNVIDWIQDRPSYPLGTIFRIRPEYSEPKCPADVPDNIRKAFLSGLTNLARADANAAAIMFRRTVELATKKLNPDASKGDNLKKRIAGLSDDLATPAMKEWAQHIRLDANEAAHEEEDYSEEDAKTLRVFAEMFLTYAFTLPEMLKRATSESSANKDALLTDLTQQ